MVQEWQGRIDMHKQRHIWLGQVKGSGDMWEGQLGSSNNLSI